MTATDPRPFEDMLATALREEAREAETRTDVEQGVVRFQQRIRSRRGGRLAPVLVPAAVIVAVLLIVGALMLAGRRTAGPPAERPKPKDIFSKVSGWIAFGDEERGIWAVDPAHPSHTQVPLTYRRRSFPLDWSADGSKLLVGRGRSTKVRFMTGRAWTVELFVLNADGTEQRVVKAGPNRFPSPMLDSASLSPDGSQVVYTIIRPVSQNRASRQIYIVDTDGGHPQLLRTGREIGWPTFSPDGTKIAYADNREYSYWVMNPDGTGAHLLFRPPGQGAQYPMNRLSWSPDGARLAFDWQGDIWTVKPNGSGLKKIDRGGTKPFWSPDGSRIAYNAGLNDILEIADPDGTHVQKIPNASSGPWNPQ